MRPIVFGCILAALAGPALAQGSGGKKSGASYQEVYAKCLAQMQKNGIAAREASYKCNVYASGRVKK
ncbi:MAG TPA: hypothetical protein VNR11_20135 [Xanthobacteraceae bacterium]|nr:hypothetical protein [Xanthobacteraceae bacterium]